MTPLALSVSEGLTFTLVSVGNAYPASTHLDDALGRGLGGEPDFLNRARAVDQHVIGAYFRERDTCCNFRARMQCQLRPRRPPRGSIVIRSCLKNKMEPQMNTDTHR